MPALSSFEVLEVLDADATVEKRASWEGFEFTTLESGAVEVVSGSHDEPDDNTHTVPVEGSIPFSCSCPEFKYQDGACKHMVAIDMREPLVEAVKAEPIMKADRGIAVERGGGDHPDERPDDCDCSSPFEDFSCWPCYRDGFR